jgi:hypothetical protein
LLKRIAEDVVYPAEEHIEEEFIEKIKNYF